MATPSLKIVCNQRFAEDLSRELSSVHDLQTFGDENDAEIAALLSDADVLASAIFKASWCDPDHCSLRLVHSVGAGTDWIDFDSLPADCKVCNVYGHQWGVAEQAMMLAMALQKKLFAMDAALRRGDWTPQPPLLEEMRQRNLLILGLGHVGQELVRWGHFLSMNVTALTRSPSKDRGKIEGLSAVGGLDELDNHLGQADFVIVAIPATNETKGLLGEKQFALMKSTAFVLNLGRAPVIDEVALYQALKNRTIAGAGLDVWYRYPDDFNEPLLPAQQPFHELDNVIMTPHKATYETMAYRWREIAENIDRLAQGAPLKCQVR